MEFQVEHKRIAGLQKKQKWIMCLMMAALMILFAFGAVGCTWGNNVKYPVADLLANPGVTVYTPMASEDCVGEHYLTIQQKFEAAGFERVFLNPICDLSLGEEDKIDTVESVRINVLKFPGFTDHYIFAEGQGFNSNDDVFVRYHCYKQYRVKIKVEFAENDLADDYSVYLRGDVFRHDKLTRGTQEEIDIYRGPGEYKLWFVSTESGDVKGECTLFIDGDTEVSYKLYCYNDRIDVETVYTQGM